MKFLEVMEFQLSYFKSSKMMLWECCTQYASKFGKLSSGHTGLEKVTFHSNPKKGNAKECSNYHTIALISHASKVMLKILQARLQEYMNWELSDAQAEFRKGRGTRDQTVNIHWIIKKARVPEKYLLLLYWLCQGFDCVAHNKLWKILKIWEYQTTLPASWEIYAGEEATVRTGHETMDWIQIGKAVCQSCILSPCLFNLYARYMMQNAGLDEAQAEINENQEKYQ